MVDRGTGGSIVSRDAGYYRLQSVQIDSGFHPVCSWKGNGLWFTSGKAGGAL